MQHYPGHVALGAAVVIVLVVLRAASGNRFVRRKLGLSIALGIVYLAGQLALPFLGLGADADAHVRSWETLLIALSILNGLVVLTINPFREDRVPERFPGIVQDAILLGLYLIVATFVFKEQLLTTSAVGAVVIGFALQDTLGNAFAGLAIQMEKPFRVGQWIGVSNYEGLVTEITWRATRLRTKAGNTIVVPNNILSKEAITNFSEPTTTTRMFVDVGVTYDAPPNDVKRVLLQAVGHLDLVLKEPPPQVSVLDFAASAITYRIKFWVNDFASDDPARDQVRTAVYYALKRAGFEIPYPQQVSFVRVEAPGRTEARVADLDRLVKSVDVFAALSDGDRATLVAEAAERVYGTGESIVRQGEAGESMFIICSGEVRVTLEPSGQEVARIPAGRYFGEMSLLTGEPRTATVAAVSDTVVLELTADTFRRLAAVHPAVVEQISREVAARREGLERSREVAAVTTASAPDSGRTFIARVQKFLRFVG